jgi:hypothetical protein
VVDRGWSVLDRARENLLGVPNGITFIASHVATATTLGYDCLGLVVRGNHATRNTGIGFRTVWVPPGGYFESAEFASAKAAVPGRKAQLAALVKAAEQTGTAKP